MRRRLDVVALLLLIAGLGCDEDNPFRNVASVVSTGESQVWELALPGFPSAWDFPTEQRLFIGAGGFSSTLGNWVLDGRADGTLILRPFSSLVEFALVRTGIQDLGPIEFDSVIEVPEAGYSAVDDSTGVAVVEGHVYAFRISRISSGVIPINYAKLRIIEAGTEFLDDPRSRFVRFEWSYQSQPLNRRVVEE
ncbi:MAG: hypothetical protein ACREMK_04280 [Gemmatimonadota bacterium]